MKAIDFLTQSLKETTREITQTLHLFFGEYRKRIYHYSAKRLNKVFEDWLVFSAKKMQYNKFIEKRVRARKKKNAREAERAEEEIRKIEEVFCRETAYTLLGRVLFARICEDKRILKGPKEEPLQLISGKGLADYLRVNIYRIKRDAYLEALFRVYTYMEDFYTHAYILNAFFDWWKLDPSVKGMLNPDDAEKQKDLEIELNFSVGQMLKRLNRFDFSKLDRDLLKDVYQHYLPPEERKSLGEFYTPDPVIKYILDRVGYRSTNSIEGRTLLDPACGSGGFLVEAARRLIGRYKRKGTDLDDPDMAKEVIETVREQIHGLDIHPFACFIAEMNLLFQVIDLYGVVRSKYRTYALKEFKIHRTDSLIPGSPKISLEVFTAENHTVKMAIEEVRQAENVKKLSFDYVVGNPPYVRVDNLPEAIRKQYKNLYDNLLTGKWDIYILFIYRGLEWLTPEGKFGYIVSNKFFLLEHGHPLRKHILNKFTIDEVVDLSGIEVFAESLPSPATVISHRGRAPKDHKISVDVKNDNHIPNSLKEHIKDMGRLKALEKVLSYVFQNLKKYNVTQERFQQDSELLFTFTIPDDITPIIRQIESQCQTLGELCGGEITEGDTFRREEPTVIKTDVYNELPENEKVGYSKVLRGGDLKHYSIDWGGDYIQDLRHAEPRRRILIKDISKRLIAAYEVGSFRCLRTIYCAYPEDASEEHIRFVLAVLNSSLMHFYCLSYFYASQMSAREGNFRFRTQFTRRLPLKKPSPKERSHIHILVGDMIAKVSEQIRLRRKISDFPRSYSTRTSKSKLIDMALQLPKFTKTTYTLSPKSLEMKTISDLFGNFHYEIWLNKKTSMTLSIKGKAQYVLESLRQRKKISKGELLSFVIPDDAERVLKEYENDKQRVLSLHKDIANLDESIDRAIYKIYGVSVGPKKNRIRKQISNLGHHNNALSQS